MNRDISKNSRKLNGLLDDSYLYISHLDEGLQYWKLYFWPDEVSDNMQSTFADTQALGRTAPVYTFSSAGPRTVQISIKLHRDLMDDINLSGSNVKLKDGEDYLDSMLNALQAIALPKYSWETKAVEPPLIALRLGNEIFVKGVLLSGINITYGKPILSNGKYARADLSLQIAEVDPYDSDTVFKNGGFRGVVQSLRSNMGFSEE